MVLPLELTPLLIIFKIIESEWWIRLRVHGGRNSCGTDFSWAECSGATGLMEPLIGPVRFLLWLMAQDSSRDWFSISYFPPYQGQVVLLVSSVNKTGHKLTVLVTSVVITWVCEGACNDNVADRRLQSMLLAVRRLSGWRCWLIDFKDTSWIYCRTDRLLLVFHNQFFFYHFLSVLSF